MSADAFGVALVYRGAEGSTIVTIASVEAASASAVATPVPHPLRLKVCVPVPYTTAVRTTAARLTTTRSPREDDVVRRNTERLHRLMDEQLAHRDKAWVVEERGHTRELTRDERRQLDHERRRADELTAAISRLPMEHNRELLAAVEADLRTACRPIPPSLGRRHREHQACPSQGRRAGRFSPTPGTWSRRCRPPGATSRTPNKRPSTPRLPTPGMPPRRSGK
ncbi:MAG: hypothetical protein ACM3ZF_12025 [Mycobacterium leprae]